VVQEHEDYFKMKRRLPVSRILIGGSGWGIVCFIAYEFLGILFDRFRGISEQADVLNLLQQRYVGQLWFTVFKLAVFVLACVLAKLTSVRLLPDEGLKSDR
jgi:hypothetical protein